MEPAISNAIANGGMLGAYVNTLMILKTTYGFVPMELPARLEDVIDGSVKAPVDLQPVRDWIDYIARELVADQYAALPEALLPRIEPALDEFDLHALQIDPNHWFTTLMTQAEAQIDIFLIELNNLAAEANVPLDIFKHGMTWQQPGKELVGLYQHTLRTGSPDAASEAVLDQVVTGNQVEKLLGAAAYIYSNGLSDALLWQPDPKVNGQGPRRPGLARLFLHALRHVGLIAEPIWIDGIGAIPNYDEKPTGVPVQLNGVWFNWLRLRDQAYVEMRDVPKDIRNRAKQCVAERAADFVGMTIHTEITHDGRVVARGRNGFTLAYVQAGQEIRVLRDNQWTITHAHAKDGNLYTVLSQA